MRSLSRKAASGSNTYGAYLPERGKAPAVTVSSRKLKGLRLAVKDVFEVGGQVTGAGNPAWRKQSAVARSSALAVSRLLEAGAEWTGRTVSDELTYSLAGINVHDGTPVNPACVDRVAGGSSSGSAVAVAAGEADIALGTDCGGSVRLPASYCGVWGFRPTHGRVANDGCFTLAHSFDTVGWFGKNCDSLSKVLEVLTGAEAFSARTPTSWRVLDGIMPLLDTSVSDAWGEWLGRPNQLRIEHVPHSAEAVLTDWAAAFRTLQAAEVWQRLGGWFVQYGDTLGVDVRRRFEAASKVSARQVTQAQHLRASATQISGQWFSDGSLVVLPTVPTVAPSRGDQFARVENVRQRSQLLLCIAGLAGLPQVSRPWISIEGAPVGLSVIGPRGSDERVIQASKLLGTF